MQPATEQCFHLRLGHLPTAGDRAGRSRVDPGLHLLEIVQAGTEPDTRRCAVRGVVIGQILAVLPFAVSGGHLLGQVLVAIARVQYVERHHTATLDAAGGQAEGRNPPESDIQQEVCKSSRLLAGEACAVRPNPQDSSARSQAGDGRN